MKTEAENIDKTYRLLKRADLRRRLFDTASTYLFWEAVNLPPRADKACALSAHELRISMFDKSAKAANCRDQQVKQFRFVSSMLRETTFLEGLQRMVNRCVELERKRALPS